MFFQKITNRRIIKGIDDFAIGRRCAANGVIRRHGVVHGAEGKISANGENIFEKLRIVKARNLHANLIAPLSLDNGIAIAKLFQTLPHDIGSRLQIGLACILHLKNKPRAARRSSPSDTCFLGRKSGRFASVSREKNLEMR